MLAHENDGDTKAVVGDLSRERAQRARKGCTCTAPWEQVQGAAEVGDVVRHSHAGALGQLVEALVAGEAPD